MRREVPGKGKSKRGSEEMGEEASKVRKEQGREETRQREKWLSMLTKTYA